MGFNELRSWTSPSSASDVDNLRPPCYEGLMSDARHCDYFFLPSRPGFDKPKPTSERGLEKEPSRGKPNPPNYRRR
jgi:hypothetical protein